jgi:alkanesulfonate monooxygenase SsuD/methylene tetrahydromethanopterin reductase-like flavin-dependent oxidoreductase (luciferase family)
MTEQLDRAQFREYLDSLRRLLQQHYRHLTDGQPHHHGPLVERATHETYGFEALILLLPPYPPLHASVTLDLIEAMASDAFDAICEPGAAQTREYSG